MTKIAVLVGIAFLQLVGALVVTLVASLALPGLSHPEDQPVLFATGAGLCFGVGIFLAGLGPVRLGWVTGGKSHLARLVASLVGVYLPMAAALALGGIRQGSPYFLASMLTGIAGFHLVGWLGKRG